MKLTPEEFYNKEMNKNLCVFQKHLGDNENYKYYENLYKGIKKEYAKYPNINFNVEKIRLKSKSKKYLGNTFNMMLAVSILLLTTAITILTQMPSIENNTLFRIGGSVVLGMGILILNVVIITKYFSKDNSEEVFYSIVLDVIDDIENSMPTTTSH